MDQTGTQTSPDDAPEHAPDERAVEELAQERPRRTAIVMNANRVEGAQELRAQITEQLAAAGWPEPAWFETTAEDPGEGQARQAVEEGAEVVMVCGGDGTVRSAIRGLVGTDAALAVVPGGTGNLLATNLGVETDASAAVALALGGGRDAIDVGEVDGETFAVMAGMGLDAHIMQDAPTNLKAKAGFLAYVVSAFKHLADDEMRVDVVIDDRPPLRRHARTVVVGNVGRLQGGLDLLPDAQPANGRLDVAIIAPRNLGHWVQLLVGVVLRRKRVPNMEVLHGEHVVVRSNRPQPRQLDGDVIEPGRVLDVRVRPGALQVCVPIGPAQ